MFSELTMIFVVRKNGNFQKPTHSNRAWEFTNGKINESDLYELCAMYQCFYTQNNAGVFIGDSFFSLDEVKVACKDNQLSDLFSTAYEETLKYA